MLVSPVFWLLVCALLVVLLAVQNRKAIVRKPTPLPPPTVASLEGFYDAGAATSRPCPGALPCERGFFCTAGHKYPCPAGTVGDEPSLRTRECSGPCPAGFYCPVGTASPLDCGGAQFYCPLGSAAPSLVPDGFYSIGIAARRRERVVPCGEGFYCSAGTQYPCPAGTYGSSARLSTAACTAPCPAGHYCPEATASPIACPAGTYGANTGETKPGCSGLCREGYFCPGGSISATTVVCGTGTYCPRGSGAPQQPTPGEYVMNGNSQLAVRQIDCPAGAYCTSVDGEAELCPPGTYGDRQGLASSACSGPCSPGYYCPRGSTSAKAFECGGLAVYCPTGSSTPISVSVGYYTVGSASIQGSDQDPADATTRSGQRKCEPGNYCVNGVRTVCPGGTFGSRFGLSSPQCSGLCMSGFFCPMRSIVATARLCGGSDYYCPEGSAAPTRVDKGYCSTSSSGSDVGDASTQTRTAQRLAAPGEFAFLGTCYPCPAGSHGDAAGETNARCAGDCLAGFYCPPGSASGTQRECGSAAVFCPRGSHAPLAVDLGFYTSVDTLELCPPGEYRDFTTTVSLFIELATGRSPVAVSYGDALFPLAQCVLCPLGMFKSVPGDDISLCVSCPQYVATSSADRRACECFRLPFGPGFDATQNKLHFDGVSCELKPLDWVDAAPPDAQPSVFTRYEQSPCEKGFYCQGGVRRPCPAGSYGDAENETRARCSGLCAPGYFCPLASTTSTARPCGDASVYCPQGSAVPRPVTPGYYTVRSPVAKPLSPGASYIALNASTNTRVRDAQRQCEPGFYCVMGLKFICPAGRYGDQAGETSPLCAGPCRRGYYCPAGSTTPTQRECGGDRWVCRTGSPAPVLVSQGYYSLGFNVLSNATRFLQQPCKPGFFCVDGVKYQCPAGTFGATPALATPQCSGSCQAGYFCPSYPYAPSTSATQFACGNSTVFCPQGTGNYPRLVGSGNFSVGADDGSGDQRNTTRIVQQRCPPGSYCRGGIRIRCPEGTYGDRDGLTSTQCSGWCPAGFFCPPGTADYRTNPCPAGSYATAGSAYCMPCGIGGKPATTAPAGFHLVGDEQQRRPCVDKHECCFFG